MTTTPDAITTPAPRAARTRFLVGGGLVLAAIVYLILTTAAGSSTYYYTIAELRARGGGTGARIWAARQPLALIERRA